MKEILQENSDAVRQAGEALVEIGTELAAGRIENALGRLEAAQQQYLAGLQCDSLLGYLFCRPLPADAACDWLLAHQFRTNAHEVSK